MREFLQMLMSGLAKSGEGHRIMPPGLLGRSVAAIATILTLYLVHYALFAPSDRHLHGSIFLIAMLPVLFLTTTTSKAFDRLMVVDYALALLSAAVGLYFAINNRFYYNIVEGVTPIPALEQAVAVVIVALSVEACRRSIGWGLTGVVVALLAYVMFGDLLIGGLHHDPIELPYFVTMQTVTHNGVFGVPLQVAATYAFLFVLFGTFYQRTGGGQLFFDVAAALAGRAVGGPAKACVVSSGLYGSISGSASADVATTGPITIPLMKSTGIPAVRAAAIESAASSGGALLPPVMGAVAFLMVEFTGIPYDEIIKAGVLAALLYYFGVFLLIHFDAQRFDEGRIDEALIVGFRTAFRRGWLHILPLAGLIYFLVEGYSPTYVAAGSTAFVVFVSWFNPDPAGRIGPRAFVEACTDTVFRMAVLTAAVLGAGIIIGCIELSGLAGKFTLMMYYVAGDDLVLTLLMTAVILILLGMGMPTPGVYVMGVALLAPVMVSNFGIPVLEAHMFLLYFACMSSITPPLAVSCFTAAAISGGNPMRIAVYAVKLGVAGFIIPFFFLFNPGLLVQGSALEVLSAVVLGIVVVLAASVAVHGWIQQSRLAWWQRLVVAALAVAMIYPQAAIQYSATVAALAGLAGLQAVLRAHAARRAT